MGTLESMKAWEKADEPEMQEYISRARRDVQLLLANQQPPEGEDYGPWEPQMTRLLRIFQAARAGGVEFQLAWMLFEGVAEVSVIVHEAVTPDGRRWMDVLYEQVARLREAERLVAAERQVAERKAAAERQMAERRAAAERRMAERLARTTGDSMADEIMAWLREQDLSRTDIYRRYSRNVSAASINDALFVLERLGWARWKMVSTGGRGREVWFLPPDEE